MTLPRLVATDLDGTLLRSGALVSDRTRAALLLAREAGAEVVFVTARPPRAVHAIAEAARVSGTAICSNGAIEYDLATRAFRRTTPLDRGVAFRVADALTEALPGVAFAVETGTGVLFEPAYGRRPHRFDPRYRREVPSVWEGETPIVKLVAWSAEQPADALFTAAVAAVEGLAEVTHSGGDMLEISAPGVTKAGALALLCEARGIEPAQVVAFGDMPNDLAVLAYAGTGYAMANAHPMVLAAVERHTLSNQEDGVAVVLERLFAP
jgi:Cof subfamily protein (haloacid dehalogenase superfamily)